MVPLPAALLRLIADESATPAPPAIAAVAAAARRRHGAGIVAVLFYGSCLRDADDVDRIADLYLLADDYGNVHRGRLMGVLNRLLPPNVYYIETPFEDRTARAKYAIVTLDQFERLVGPRTSQSYFWARFAQPTIILWAATPAVRERLVRALATAVLTTVMATQPLLGSDRSCEALWLRAFREAYRAELRAETPDRAAALYRAYPDRYAAIAEILRDAGTAAPGAAPRDRRLAERQWRRRRVVGKTLSVLRLMKSAFTFEDGASYLMWKIGRHSGVHVELTPWQKRHPILASSTLFWKIYRAGGFR